MQECNCGGPDGDSSCYQCLRSYYNQRYHDLLSRGSVIEFMNEVLNNKHPVDINLLKEEQKIEVDNSDQNKELHQSFTSSSENEDKLIVDGENDKKTKRRKKWDVLGDTE